MMENRSKDSYTILNQLEKFFKEVELDCKIVKGSSSYPMDQLLIFLGNDYQDREKIMRITAQSQEMGQNLKKSSKELEQFFRIQFQIIYPFEILDTSLKDIASAVCFINHQLDFPGLEFNEIEGRIQYRYVLLANSKGFDTTLCTSIVGIQTMVTDLFLETLEIIASGKMTFNTLLEKIVEIDLHKSSHDALLQ